MIEPARIVVGPLVTWPFTRYRWLPGWLNDWRYRRAVHRALREFP
jgi:hypothetical protein